jgi:hypothetical protein
MLAVEQISRTLKSARARPRKNVGLRTKTGSEMTPWRANWTIYSCLSDKAFASNAIRCALFKHARSFHKERPHTLANSKPGIAKPNQNYRCPNGNIDSQKGPSLGKAYFLQADEAENRSSSKACGTIHITASAQKVTPVAFTIRTGGRISSTWLLRRIELKNGPARNCIKGCCSRLRSVANVSHF